MLLKLFNIAGKVIQKITHQMFQYWSDGDFISAMCIIDSYLWITSSRRGLLRFPIRLQRTNQEDVEWTGGSQLNKGLHSRLSRGISETDGDCTKNKTPCFEIYT